MATHSSILAWRIPWTEGLGGLQSWGRIESDTTEQLTQMIHITYFKHDALFSNVCGCVCDEEPLVARMVKDLPAMQKLGSISWLGRSPGEGNGNHSSIPVWRIPWTEELAVYSPWCRKESDTTE